MKAFTHTPNKDNPRLWRGKSAKPVLVMVCGFTLIEILLVVIILTILTGSAVPISINFYKTQQLDINVKAVVQSLRRAQLKAMSIESDSSFGVYLTNDSYTLFKGGSFDTRDIPYDEVFDLPQVITISGIQEIAFSKFEGMPIGGLTGDIILNSNGDSRIININEIGRINLQ